MKKQLFYITFILIINILSSARTYAAVSGSYGRLDSIVYQLNDLSKVRKAIYEYNANKISSITISEAATLNDPWTPVQKILYSEVLGLQTTIEQTYSASGHNYKNYIKNDVSFDDKSNRNLEAYYMWDDSALMWKGFRSKIERTYNDTGVISAFTYSNWNSLLDSWNAYSSGTIKFNSFRKPEEIIYSTPNNQNQLTPSSKVVTSYLANYNPEYETTFSYDTLSSNYIPSYRTHFEYADVAPQYTETVETFSSSNQTWSPVQKIEKSYNSGGDLIRSLVADRDTLTQSWSERFRHDYTVLSNASDSLNILQNDAPNGTSLFIKKFKIVSDGNGKLKISNSVEQNSSTISTQNGETDSTGGDLKFLSNSDDLENIKLSWDFNATNSTLACSTYGYNSTTKQRELVRTATFYFNPNGTVVPKILDDNNVSFWPNPVESVLNLSNSTSSALKYRILTLEGKPLKSGITENRVTTISVNSLQPGAYIIQLSVDNRNSKTRIFIKK